MATKGYFAHTSPEGLTPWHWFDLVKYHYSYAGENLAVYFSDTHSTVVAWLNSPTHRANLLSTKYTQTGLAERPEDLADVVAEKLLFEVSLTLVGSDAAHENDFEFADLFEARSAR
jgi:hypothetical protein